MKQRHHRAQQKLAGPLRSQSSFVKLGTELSLYHQFYVLSSARGTEKWLVPEKPGICHLSRETAGEFQGSWPSKLKQKAPICFPSKQQSNTAR